MKLNNVYRLTHFLSDDVRILYILSDSVVVISLLKENSLPYIIRQTDIDEAFMQNNIEEIPFNRKETIILPTDTQKTFAEKNWDIICDFVNEEPLCYDKKARSLFISSQSKKVGTTRFQIQKILYKYWSGGKNKQALYPNYHNCGAAGRERFSKKKLGRHKKFDEENKIIIGEAEKKQIKSIIDKYYNRTVGSRGYQACYERLLRTYYWDEENRKIADSYPSETQFRYHAAKYVDEKKRVGAIIYNKDMRGITGSSRGEAYGPGDVYQIDATKADIYLVARNDRTTLVGRPTLYFVLDVFSHMVTGFYCSLGEASWENAKMALICSFSNKVEICKKYGIDISEEEWPCEGLVRNIIVDNGELISKASDSLVDSLGITVKNEPAWRPDLKGIVESSFRLLNLNVKDEIPGTVKKDHKQRTGRDYRYDAILTFDEFNETIIRHILCYNSRMISESIQLAPDIRAAQIDSIPIELWKWGCVNRTPALSKIDSEKLHIFLGTKGDATVTSRGIKFHNLYYECNTAKAEYWFDNARVKGTWKEKVSYNPYDVSKIYLLRNNGFEICSLTADSKENFNGSSFDEVDIYFELVKSRHAQSKRDNNQLQIELHSEIDKITEKAKQKRKEAFRGKMRIDNMKQVRKAENAERIAEQHNSYSASSEISENKKNIDEKVDGEFVFNSRYEEIARQISDDKDDM